MSGGEVTTYLIRSLRRSSSATSPGSVSNRSSSTTIRGRVISIFFLTPEFSCGCICQIRTLSRESQANFMVNINGGDVPQDVFERTEYFCGPLWNVNGNVGIRNRRVLAVWIQDWLWESAGADDTIVLTRTLQRFYWFAFSLSSTTNVLFWRGDTQRSA